MPHTLPELGYPHDALEPYIDKATMEIHHGKHHNAYVTNLNATLESHPELAELSLEELQGKIADIIPLRHNGGGHYHHSLFWKVIAPGGASEPSGELAAAIDAAFGSFDAFKEEFAKAGATRFGSGWAWLGVKQDGTLGVCSTPNQDNPLMGESAGVCGCTPILGLDVWEHAYYLHYQNRRPDYIAAFWNVVNWDVVAELYAAAK